MQISGFAVQDCMEANFPVDYSGVPSFLPLMT